MINKNADGLRGFAVFNVMIGHFFFAFRPVVYGDNQITSLALNSLVGNGHLAVLIFFVLSGYVLSIPFMTKQHDWERVLKRRVIGRYIRLNIPILVATIASYVFYKLGFYFNDLAGAQSGSTDWFQIFYGSDPSFLVAMRDGFYGSILFGYGDLVPPLWSLKIEFVGSIFLLICLIFLKNIYSTLFLIIFFISFINFQDGIYFLTIFSGIFVYKIKPNLFLKISFLFLGIYLGSLRGG